MKRCLFNVFKHKIYFMLICIGYCFTVFVKSFMLLAPYYYSDFALAVNTTTAEASFSSTNLSQNNDITNDDVLPLVEAEEAIEKQAAIQNFLQKYSKWSIIVILFIFLVGAMVPATVIFFVWMRIIILQQQM